MVHIYNRILLSHKKEWHNAICNNMAGHRDCHTEWRRQRKINIIWYHFYVESKKNGTNEPIYKTETHNSKETYSYWGGKEGEG